MAFLLLHGLGGDRSQPLSLLGPALPADATILAPDLRAHGASTLIGNADDFSLDAMTSELAHAAEYAGLADGPLTIIGISLGAALALRLAATGLFDVERFIALRPAFTDEPLPRNLAVFPVIAELLHRHGAEHAERLFRSTSLYRELFDASPLGAAGAIEQFRKPDAVRRAVRLVELPRNRAFDRGLDTRGLLAAVPTTIIAAPRDPLHPLSVAELWHRLLPDATLTQLPARDDGLRAYVAATREATAAALR